MKLETRILLAFLASALACFPVAAQELIQNERGSDSSAIRYFALNTSPGVTIPIGEAADRFDIGGKLDLNAEYTFGDRPGLYVLGGVGYGFAPIQVQPAQSTSLLSVLAGAGVNFDVIPRFALKAFAAGGGYYGFLNDPSGYSGTGVTSGSSALLHAGLDFELLLSPVLGLNLGATYKNYIGLMQGVEFRLGSSFYLKGLGQRRLKIQSSGPTRPELLMRARFPDPGRGIRINSAEFEPVFPVFHKYYDDHPIGRLEIVNQETETISDLSVTLFVKEYMDGPKECLTSAALAGSELRIVDLYALFNNDVLEITEGTKVSCDINLLYRMEGEWYQDTRTETVRLHNRNAMIWDDDRRAAAFVTARDPAVLSFSKNVSATIRDKASTAINGQLLQAIGIFQAMKLYGLNYVVDPSTPHSELSQNANQIDFLQFPRQTLNYKAGDCDDLSILYCALLESIGVETAFITVPGHIFTAFSLDISPEQAGKEFLETDDLILLDDHVWIPVEVTERKSGFVKAWEVGAANWRRYEELDSAQLYPVREAWAMYEPVGLPGGSGEVMLPRDETVINSYLEEVMRFIDREIFPRVVELEDEIERTGGSPAVHNRLGILYAKYGKIEEAEEQFSTALSMREYVPALINLGNLRSMEDDWQQALVFYKRAYEISPSSSTALLCISRAHHELEQYREARRAYAELMRNDRQLAERFAYLGSGDGSGQRAADVTALAEVVIWEQE